MTTLEFRRASVGDVDTAAAILEDAIAWASARGMDSWEPGVFADPDGWGRQRLIEALAVDGLYLAVVDGEPVATFSLLPDDLLFWPGAPPDALYLHRFAVRERFAGSGAGAAALAWMADEARRAGRRFIRLDALAENPGIRAYYERAGFRHRGAVTVANLPFALYELDLSP